MTCSLYDTNYHCYLHNYLYWRKKKKKKTRKTEISEQNNDSKVYMEKNDNQAAFNNKLSSDYTQIKIPKAMTSKSNKFSAHNSPGPIE